MNPALNSPETRQSILKDRLSDGAPLVLAALAEEFGVSVDTVRRDVLALEAEGLVSRVRGGALPILAPSDPVVSRIETGHDAATEIAKAALPLVEDGMVVMLDGGTTVAALARLLPVLPRGMIVTPSPIVAQATLARGIETLLIGGRLSGFGGIAAGREAESQIARVAADLCILGACGVDVEFGLSADNLDEAGVKHAMQAASNKTIVSAGAARVGRRARHQAVPTDGIDLLITDASIEQTKSLREAGMDVKNVKL